HPVARPPLGRERPEKGLAGCVPEPDRRVAAAAGDEPVACTRPADQRGDLLGMLGRRLEPEPPRSGRRGEGPEPDRAIRPRGRQPRGPHPPAGPGKSPPPAPPRPSGPARRAARVRVPTGEPGRRFPPSRPGSPPPGRVPPR